MAPVLLTSCDPPVVKLCPREISSLKKSHSDFFYALVFPILDFSSLLKQDSHGYSHRPDTILL